MTPTTGAGAPESRAPASSAWLLAVLGAGAIVLTFLQGVATRPSFDPPLDSDWMSALHYSAIHRLGWGREIVMNQGPLGFLMTRQVWSETAPVVAVYRILLGAAFAVSLISLGRLLGWSLRYIAALAVLYVPAMRLGLDQTTNGLLLVVTARLFIASPRGELAYPLLATLVLASLSLTKFTFGIIGAALIGLYVLRLTVARQLLAATVIGGGYVVSVIGFWLSAAQRLADLPAFLHLSIQVAVGYGDAMSLSGPNYEVISYLLPCCALVAFVIGVKPAGSQTGNRFLLIALAMLLFIGFKHGFVRQDAEHALIASHLLFAAILLYGAIQWHRGGWSQRYVRAAYIFAVLGTLHNLTVTLAHYVPGELIDAGLHQIGAITETSAARLRHPTVNEATINEINSRALSDLIGPTDIFSHGQQALFASKRQWRPRPVFQSLAVYTPSLARTNAQSYGAPDAPLNVLFRLETIDHRYPSLDDALLWPILLSRYDVVDVRGRYLLLRRSLSPRPYTLHPRHEVETRFGDEIPVPHGDARLVWTTIDVRPTGVGRLASLIYKLPLIQLETTTLDGQRRVHRLVRGSARVGFLLSPMIITTGDFGVLASEDRSRLIRSQGVRSIRLLNAWVPGWLDNAVVHVRFWDLELAAQKLDASRLWQVDVVESLLKRRAEPSPRLTMVRLPPDGGAALALAPSRLILQHPPSARYVDISFGTVDLGWQSRLTEGVEFRVSRGSGDTAILWRKVLIPRDRVEDRGVLKTRIPLPDTSNDGALFFETLPSPNGPAASDWAFWSAVRFSE